mgnify:CR=1 FL=1
MRLHKRFDMMTTKRLYLLLLGFALIGMKAQAQHVSFGPLHSQDSPREDWLLPGDTVYQDGKTVVYGGKPVKNTYTPIRHIDSNSDELYKMGSYLKNPQDSDYYNNTSNEGHIFVKLKNEGDNDIILKKHDRYVQGIIQKYYIVDNEKEIEDIRVGGIGSSGRRDK